MPRLYPAFSNPAPHQNRYLAVNVTLRIDPTFVTCPNVGEFRMVSMVVYCGWLKTLFAETLSSSARVSFANKVLLTDMPKLNCRGPRMMLRLASPNCPAGGIMNAAVLNHSPMVGLLNEIGAPVRSARSVPFTPCVMSLAAPNTRGVNGNPEAMVKLLLHCQSPKRFSSKPPLLFNHFLPVPTGS